MDEETRHEIIQKLDEVHKLRKEEAHMEANDLLLEALRLAGYKDIADAWDRAFNRIDFWYS